METTAPYFIHKTIHINTPPTAVWTTLTTPAYMQQWISDADITITADWQPGGAIVFCGDLHGILFENKGIVLQYEKERLLQYSYWSSLSGQPDLPENYAVITFLLTDATTLTLTQSNITTKVIYQHFNFYWNTALDLIRKVSERALPD